MGNPYENLIRHEKEIIFELYQGLHIKINRNVNAKTNDWILIKI